MTDLTPCQLAIISALHRAKTWVPAERLNALTAPASMSYDHAGDLRGRNALSVHIHMIREKLGEDAILSFWGRGYTLGAPGIHVVRAMTKMDGTVEVRG